MDPKKDKFLSFPGLAHFYLRLRRIIRQYTSQYAKQEDLDVLTETVKSMEGQGFEHSELPIIIIPEQQLEDMKDYQAVEGILYYGYEESKSEWHFGDSFPIRFS